MNRPFGAVDVSANLKGAVPKTATQKILVALAEKGEIVQKTYGGCSFANVQAICASLAMAYSVSVMSSCRQGDEVLLWTCICAGYEASARYLVHICE